MQFIDLKTLHQKIELKLKSRFDKIFAHGSYIMGPEVEELETVLSKFLNVEHAITVASGTDALLIALMALDIGRDDEIITTPFSFFATAEVIALLGAKPVFVDIDPKTYNIDATLIEKAITKKTKAIMPVSLYGQCAEFNAINAIANKHNLPVIEDGAQSFGAKYYDSHSCALSTIGCTSFFPSKPLGCYGDGGACFTNDANLARKMAEIRIHGQESRYHHTSLGINGRFDTMQAAVLLEKMQHFAQEVELRQEVANRYKDLLPESISPPFVHDYNTSVYAQYTIEVDDRPKVQAFLQSKNIPTAVHYPLGLHKQPIFQKLYPSTQEFINTQKATNRVLSLPMHPYLSKAQQIDICDALKQIYI